MGCYDGTELYELVGSFILNKLTSIINKSDRGLCHDGRMSGNKKEQESNS